MFISLMALLRTSQCIEAKEVRKSWLLLKAIAVSYKFRNGSKLSKSGGQWSKRYYTGHRIFHTTAKYKATSYFLLRLINKDNKEVFVDISTSEMVNMSKKEPAFKSPDLALIVVKKPKGIHLNYLNQYMQPVKKFDGTSQVTVYGFPVVDEVSNKDQYIRLGPSKLVAHLLFPYEKPIRWTAFNYAVDYNNYQLKIDAGEPKPGFSGFPVFLRINGKTVFGGLAFGGDVTELSLSVLKPDVIIRVIESSNH